MPSCVHRSMSLLIMCSISALCCSACELVDDATPVSELATIEVVGLEADQLPWNAKYAGKPKSELANIAKEELGLKFRLAFRAPGRCHAANFSAEKLYPDIAFQTTVTRGCQYRVSLQASARGQEFLVLKNSSVDYLVPDAPQSPMIDLQLCTTEQSSAYFQSQSCKTVGQSAVHIAGGSTFSCALRQGKLQCWGAKYPDRRDKGAQARAEVPADLSDVVAFDTGFMQSCAILKDRSVRCWGDYRHTANAVPSSLKDVSQISVGLVPCAISNRQLVCWGFEKKDKDPKDPNFPPPADLGPVDQVAVGFLHICSLSSGKVRCWGHDEDASVLAVPTDLGPVVELAAGSYHACAREQSGRVRCWGETGGFPDNLIDPQITQVEAGYAFTCVLKHQSVQCFGEDDATDYLRDDRWTIPSNRTQVPPDLGPVSQIAVGDQHVCALQTDNKIRCWGYDYYGQTEIPAGW